jgi:hypothetical protein
VHVTASEHKYVHEYMHIVCTHNSCAKLQESALVSCVHGHGHVHLVT